MRSMCSFYALYDFNSDCDGRYEQIFVYNLLLHLKCGEVDMDYTPAHGLGAVPAISISRTSKSRTRRNPY